MTIVLEEITSDVEDERVGKRAIGIIMRDDQTGELRNQSLSDVPNDNTAKAHVEARFANESGLWTNGMIIPEEVAPEIPESPVKTIFDNLPDETQAITAINNATDINDIKAILVKMIKVIFKILKLIKRRG